MTNNVKPCVTGQDVEVSIAMEERNGGADGSCGDEAVDEFAHRFPVTTAKAEEHCLIIMRWVGWKDDCPCEQTSK